jgi:DNA-binding transcriptional MerR regulator
MTTHEVSRRTGATLRQLRWWDETGLVSVPKKGGERRYDQASCELVRAVMVCRRAGLALSQVRRLIDIHGGVFSVWVTENRKTIHSILSVKT